MESFKRMEATKILTSLSTQIDSAVKPKIQCLPLKSSLPSLIRPQSVTLDFLLPKTNMPVINVRR